MAGRGELSKFQGLTVLLLSWFMLVVGDYSNFSSKIRFSASFSTSPTLRMLKVRYRKIQLYWTINSLTVPSFHLVRSVQLIYSNRAVPWDQSIYSIWPIHSVQTVRFDRLVSKCGLFWSAQLFNRLIVSGFTNFTQLL